MTPEQIIISVPLGQLILSDSSAQAERRGRFQKGPLEELAKSLVTTGQINPIVVRPAAGKSKKYEIVAGERRYIAAGIAMLPTITCAVRELTDQQVLEVQIIENLQREDLHELAEAEAYEALVKMGRTPAQIAGQVHRDESYVRKRMRLLALGKKGRKAFYDGRITVAVAIILARIPVEKLQDEALEWYLDAGQYDQITTDEFREQVQRDFMTDLSTAPFDITDPDLVKGATACAVCPKNTLCQQQLFDDIKGKAHCTDSVCFQAKRMAHGERLLEKAKKSGREVITGKEAKRVAEHGRSHLVGYVDVAGHAHGQPVKKLLKGVDPAKLKLLQLPGTGEVIEVAPVSLVNKAKPESSSSSTDDWRARQRASEKKRAFELNYRAQLFKTIYVEGKGSSDTEDLRLACEAMFDRLHHDGVVRFFKVMGLEPIEKKDQYRGKVKRYEWSIVAAQAKDVAGLWRLLRALSVAGDLEVYSHGTATRTDRLHKLAERVGVKASKLYDSLKAEAAAKAKPKAKAKKKAARK